MNSWWVRRWPYVAVAIALVVMAMALTQVREREPAAATVLPQVPVPRVTSVAPADSPGDRASSIWLPYWDLADAVRTVTANAEVFHTASLFSYDASCRRLHAQPGAGDRRLIRRLHAAGVQVVVTLTGAGLGPAESIRCFARPKTRRAHIAKLVRLVKSRSYDGIDLDYENLALTGKASQAARVRAAYTTFVRELRPRIQALGKSCIITVMSRTAHQPRVVEGRLSPSVFDYTAISAAATRMRVMTYDQHTRHSRPGPVAGYPWVKQVIAYIKTHTDESKVELGVPLYGRNWGTHSFDTLIGNEARRLARKHRKIPFYHPLQREFTFAYTARGQRHRVWFSGPRSEADRVQLALDEGLAGGAFWAAGQQQRRSWDALRRR